MYFVRIESGDIGPLSISEIKYGPLSDTFDSDTQVREVDATEFVKLGSLLPSASAAARNPEILEKGTPPPKEELNQSVASPAANEDASVALSKGQQYSNSAQRNQGTIKYVVAWLCLCGSVAIVSVFRELFFRAISLSIAVEDTFQFSVVNLLAIPLFNLLASFGLIYFWYRIVFSSLLFKKVLPWFYVVGSLVLLMGIGETASVLSQGGVDLPLIQIRAGVDVSAFLLLIFLLRKYVQR